jgi:hypothetical protein
MDQDDDMDDGPVGWDWFEVKSTEATAGDNDDLARSFARCFSGGDGGIIIDHLRQTFLDRRLGPGASDAELRFLEGQRSVVAHILSMIQRGS